MTGQTVLNIFNSFTTFTVLSVIAVILIVIYERLIANDKKTPKSRQR